MDSDETKLAFLSFGREWNSPADRVDRVPRENISTETDRRAIRRGFVVDEGDGIVLGRIWLRSVLIAPKSAEKRVR